MPCGRHAIDNGEPLCVSELATKLDDSACGYRRGEANGVEKEKAVAVRSVQ